LTSSDAVKGFDLLFDCIQLFTAFYTASSVFVPWFSGGIVAEGGLHALP
jgi:hypothetical protein